MLSAKLIPIKSSCFNASGYFNGRAAFRFCNGRVIYREITASLWQQFMDAESKGTFFREKIKSLRQGRECSLWPANNTPAIFKNHRGGELVVPPPPLNQVPGAAYSLLPADASPGNPDERFQPA